jgi:hypothetical protein
MQKGWPKYKLLQGCVKDKYHNQITVYNLRMNQVYPQFDQDGCTYFKYFNTTGNWTKSVIKEIDEYFGANKKALKIPICKLDLNKSYRINFILERGFTTRYC